MVYEPTANTEKFPNQKPREKHSERQQPFRAKQTPTRSIPYLKNRNQPLGRELDNFVDEKDIFKPFLFIYLYISSQSFAEYIILGWMQ